MITFGIIGMLTISFSIWQKSEKSQDIWFTIGGLLLLIYSVYIKDPIFIILETIFVISSLAEIYKLARKKK